MRGNERVIAALNEALRAELTSINQYFVHSEMDEHWRYERLEDIIKSFSITEMKHAERFIERILFLEGEPDMQPFSINIGRDVKQHMENDLALEMDAVAKYNASIAICREVGDNRSRELFEDILKDEEFHVNRIEAQLHEIQELGYERYLSQQVRQKKE